MYATAKALLFGALLFGEASAESYTSRADQCTAMAIGKHATAHDGTIVTHTNDCFDCDGRLVAVPARDHPEGAMRPVPLARFNYPRYVGEEFSDEYKLELVDREIYPWNNTVPIGYIPQVAHTYGYLDGDYPIVNEHGLTMGESTCGARFKAPPAGSGGTALMDISVMMRVAMERCQTARCAIEVMGGLAVDYGFYSAPWDGNAGFTDAGEAVTIGDGEEAWVFHVLPDNDGSAVWAAQRVPSHSVAVVSNQFIIREIDLDDPDNYMASDNVVSEAVAGGLFDPTTGAAFDFTAAYAEPRKMYPYATRRQWRVYELVNKHAHVSPLTTPLGDDYPFAQKVDHALTVEDVMTINRDHYEGSSYDMTKGLAGGPYGDPSRYDLAPTGNLTLDDLMNGQYERAISLFRASYSHVTLSRNDIPKQIGAQTWFGRYEPRFTFYTPFYAGSSNVEVPPAYRLGTLYKAERTSVFWGHLAVGNWADRFYLHALPIVEAKQSEIESALLAAQPAIEKKAQKLLKAHGEARMEKYLTKVTTEASETALAEAWGLFETLVASLHDGMQVTNFHEETINPAKLFYPLWWLEQTGYFDIDDRDRDPQMAGLEKEIKQALDDSHDVSETPLQRGTGTVVAFVFVAMGMGVATGMAFGKTYYQRRKSYQRIVG